MTILRRLAALTAVLVVLGACSNGPGASTATLSDTNWTVVTLDRIATIATNQPTILFGSDGKISGNASCNSYTGTYKLDGKRIAVSPLASTQMACEPAVSAQETIFLDALTGATNWAIDQGNLSLSGLRFIVGAPKT